MTTTTTRKEDIPRRFDGGREYPAINVKVYGDFRRVSLPLPLGRTSDDGGATWRDVTSEPSFTQEWIEENLTDAELETVWDWTRQDGWENAEFLAKNTLGDHVRVWSDGRSGGWLIVDGLDPIDTWDAIALGRWRKFERQIRNVVEDIPFQMVSSIYHNLFLPDWEEQQAEADDEAAAELPVDLGV